MAYTIMRGGRVLDIRAGTADTADILIEDDTIREVGPPGLPAPEGAREITAARRLIHPGLVNAHTHSHGNLGKGMGDRWTLELLLAAAPWIIGNRSADDIHLSAQIGAVEMVLKGCTALYDLFSNGRSRQATALRRSARPMRKSAFARSSRRWLPTAPFTRRYPASPTSCRPLFASASRRSALHRARRHWQQSA